VLGRVSRIYRNIPAQKKHKNILDVCVFMCGYSRDVSWSDCWERKTTAHEGKTEPIQGIQAQKERCVVLCMYAYIHVCMYIFVCVCLYVTSGTLGHTGRVKTINIR
jgi:hypothetical protein